MSPVFDIRETKVSVLQIVYKTICYFDIFSYPLKRDEILRYAGSKLTAIELDEALNELIVLAKIKSLRNYFLLSAASPEIINKRVENEIRLTRKLPVIRKFAKLVSRFPFVEAVFISGSVSKGILNEDGDVDYFIVAKHNRLWLCRTLMVLFKKVVLFNSKKYFCVNYFVSPENLRIPDENIFVATEVKSLLPVFKNQYTQAFEMENKWANLHLPNIEKQPEAMFCNEIKKPIVSNMLEKICSGTLGEKLDDRFFRFTLKKWQKKFPHFKAEEFDLNMRSYKNVSKHHPQGYQGKVLESLSTRLKQF